MHRRGGARVGKGKEGAREGRKKDEGGGGRAGKEKKGSGKGILAIPILVCFRCCWKVAMMMMMN